MKHSLLFIGLLSIGFIFTGSTWHSAKATDAYLESPTDSSSIPADIYKIMENSCLACHGAEGKPLTLAKLNLADWNSYSPEKQVKKASAIYKEVSEGDMPPEGFIKKNPGAKLTDEQIKSILQWHTAMSNSK